MTPVPRLDYSKTPSGYRLLSAGGPYWWGNNAVWLDSSGDRTIAISDAWAHYKRHNDPPGLTVAWEPADEHRDPDGAGDWEVTLISPTGTTTVVWWRSVEAKGAVVEIGTVSVAARAAAWAWYDRRLAIAAGFDALGSDPWPWPECLSWSDKQASTAELHLGSALPPDGGPTRG